MSRRGYAVRQQALPLGLVPVEPVARTPEQVDALLADHPDAVLLVRPEPGPAVPDPESGAVLWSLLRAGAALWMCAPGQATSEAGRALRPLLGYSAIALAEQARERDCQEAAHTLGLFVELTVDGSDGAWRAAGRFAATRTRPGRGAWTVLVHPDTTAPEPSDPDARLWPWLRRGVLIASWDLTDPAAGTGRGLFVTSSGAMAPELRVAEEHTNYLLGRPRSHGAPPSPAAPAPAATTAGVAPPPRARLGAPASEIYSHLSPLRPASPYSPPSGPFHTPRDTSRPLPHDGLYVRRNNAFGTRSVLGAKELIEQGVIIGQEHIRFDDFVVSRDGQVPGPGAGEAVAVSHGLAAVSGEFKANEATTHFVEIALKAGPTPSDPGPAAQPLPVNFVFVVDTSSSMYGEKLDTVRSALHTIYGRLRPTDCLGIITFDHGVRTVLPAATKEDLERSGKFTAALSALRAEGGTDINLGVSYGIDEISRNAVNGRTVNCLYLFSDGDPTSGERDWIKIRTNIAARLRGDLTLSCFGFGSDARMPELAALAGLAGGHSTFVTRPEQVKADLLGDLNRRDHLAAIDIQLRLDIDPAVEIWHVYGHDLVTDPRARAEVIRAAGQAAARAREDYGTEALPDIITGESGIRIFAPDLAFEETYWVVLEVRVPPDRDLAGLGTAVVQYVDTQARESRRHTLDLALGHALAEETVLVHGVGLWTSEVTFYALDDLYDRDKEAAKKRLERHLNTLQIAHRHVPAPEFRDDSVTLRKFMTLADSLGTVMSFSDHAHGGGFASAIHGMNEFGRMRSGYSPRW
ncbi:VWA domain-containing protein [Streptomyces hyaluromycini]|uniref:VWA domain-containing protein n=1 Tax=Streptomyces hyaluromycini TaxID=1377993 RepID=UPI0011AE4B9B|nr:VWA domain-containing protein [Streptomyces hyaluromycini]